MLGSVRDDENVIFSVASKPGAVAGMTLPRAMVKWFRSAGYTNVSEQAHIAWWPLETRMATARYASNLQSGGYKVCMLIDADVMDPDVRDKDKINVPNHWVTLTSPMIEGSVVGLDDIVSFSVYSWGQQWQLETTGNQRLTLRRVLQKFYGFVAARLLSAGSRAGFPRRRSKSPMLLRD